MESTATIHEQSGSQNCVSATGRLESAAGATHILDFGHCLKVGDRVEHDCLISCVTIMDVCNSGESTEFDES